MHNVQSENLRVAMLVNNPCVNDSRVIREAEALALAGYEVVVLAKRAPGIPNREERNGVQYRRFVGFADGWYPDRRRSARLIRWLRGDHHRRVWFGKLAASLLGVAYRRGAKVPRPSAPAQAAPAEQKPAPKALKPANAKPRHSTSRSRLVRIVMFPVRVTLRSIWTPTGGLVKSGLQASRRLIVAPATRWAKRFIGAALVFEDIDVAMRQPLLRLRPDVIHAHDLMTLPTASMTAAELNAALVYDSHELELHRNATYPKLAWMRRARLEKRHIRRASLVITVSDSIADHLSKQYRIPRPIVVLNAPPLSQTRPTTASIRVSLGVDSHTPLAIYVGAVTVNRGLDVCVRALAHFPELHLATIGPRRKPTEEALIALAAAEGVSGRFHLVDPVPPDDVVSFIKDADVSLLPIQNVCLSYYYCMPNKLFESVLASVPVAVANLLELGKFVKRYECGLVMDETDPASIAKTVHTIINDRAHYVLEESQLERMRARYSWPSQQNKLLKGYAKMSLRRAHAEKL